MDYAYQGQRTRVRGYHTTVPVTAEYAYDHLGRVTDIAAGTGVDFHYDYVANENNIWKKTFDHRNGSPYNEYSYDDIDRLTRADYLKGLTTEYEAFNMDDLGNRQTATLRDGSGDTYAVDALTNRYDSIDSVSLDYDAAGNLTRDKDGYVYGYDYENRIVEIRNSADALIAEMNYDTQGRRIRVYDAAAGTETLYYYSDNWQVLSQYTGGTLDKSFVFGDYIDEVLVMLGDTNTFFYLHDHLYSPVALINPAGTVVERYEYDAYGKANILSANYEQRTMSSYANAYYFTGREVDSLDNGSLPLQYNRHRYLSQYMGRWYSHDPLGINPAGGKQNSFSVLKQYSDGTNVYEYAKSSSTINKDAHGLETDNSKACCKTQTRTATYTVGPFGTIVRYTKTACTQVTIDSKGAKPNHACKCHFRGQPNVKVYGYHSGECCWCYIYYYRFPGGFAGLPSQAHAAINVICEQGRTSWSADVWPTENPFRPHYVPVVIRDGGLDRSADAGRGLPMGRISCDAADSWKSAIASYSWLYQFPFKDCRDFASVVGSEMASTCP